MMRVYRPVLCAAPLLASLWMVGPASAAPAAPTFFDGVQPDGATFSARLQGDEWCNWLEDDSGYTLQRADDGFAYYVAGITRGRAVLSDIRAGDVPPAGIELRLHEPCAAPPRASRPRPQAGASQGGAVLFILASFTDREGTYTEDDFAGFLENNVVDFYRTISYGAVNLTPADETGGTANNGVVGWVNVGYRHPDTGGSTGWRNQKLAKDAIIAADAYVDYAAYDTNADGYVDADELAVVVIAAGYEAAYGELHPSLWGHQWDLSLVGAAQVDGVRVGDPHGGAGGYAQFGEIHQSTPTDGHQATMGIMVHELGHLIFGMPDLYDTDYSSNGAGAFCYMSFGAWGYAATDAWSGETPVMPCAWIKVFMGWATPSTTTGAVGLVASGADNASPTNSACRASTGRSSEYFLVENRQVAGYDRGLEGILGESFGGIAIWHIDDAVSSNSNDNHRRVDLEEADASTTAYEPTNLWYLGNPKGGARFDSTSTPNSNTYNRRPSSVSVTNFSAPAELMSVTVNSTYNARAAR